MIRVGIVEDQPGIREGLVALLQESPRFDTWKKLDERLLHLGRPHLFELLGIRHAAQAADLLRRFTAFTGISKIDDFVDEVHVTTIVKSLLVRIGIN